jgi:ribulose-phosphate 3-epimerase
MNHIIPAILVHDEAAFRERLDALDPRRVPIVQIDVMDGAFVPNTTWCDLAMLASLETRMKFELHLMVEDPEPWIRNTEDIPAVQRLVWHIESRMEHEKLIKLCHTQGRDAGLALSPATSLETLVPYADTIDEILVLGVNPGFSGQDLIPETMEKAREIHARWPDVPLAFDGHVDLTNIQDLKDAGVSRFCVASAIFDEPDPGEAFAALEDA